MKRTLGAIVCAAMASLCVAAGVDIARYTAGAIELYNATSSSTWQVRAVVGVLLCISTVVGTFVFAVLGAYFVIGRD